MWWRRRIGCASRTLPSRRFEDPRAWGVFLSVALIAIATIPESTAHLYQMSLYIDDLARNGRSRTSIKRLIGFNLVADGSDDLWSAFWAAARVRTTAKTTL